MDLPVLPPSPITSPAFTVWFFLTRVRWRWAYIVSSPLSWRMTI